MMLRLFFLSFFSIILTKTNSIDTTKLKSLTNFSSNLSIKDIFINQDSLDAEDLFEVQIYESKI